MRSHTIFPITMKLEGGGGRLLYSRLGRFIKDDGEGHVGSMSGFIVVDSIHPTFLISMNSHCDTHRI